jgi:hypothetical protein
MKKIIILSFTIGFVLGINAQEKNYNIIEKEMYYIQTSISSKVNYPIFLSGVCELNNFSTTDFNFVSTELFLKSFYSKCKYTPELFFEQKELVSEAVSFLNRSDLLLFYDYNNIQMKNLFIKKFDNEESFILQDHRHVTLSILKVKGLFIVMNKNNAPIDSNGIDVNEIEEINDIYVPFLLFKD